MLNIIVNKFRGFQLNYLFKKLKYSFIFIFFLFSIEEVKSQCALIDTVLFEGFCYGSTGSLTIVPNYPQIPGNPPPYHYSIDGGITLNTTPSDSVFTNLIPGTYDVWMQDLANPGCVDLVTIVIPDPQDIITAIATVNSNLTCYGDSVGVATVNAIGGVLPYTYLWPSGETTQQAGNLWAGNGQIVFVTDANGCEIDVNFNITNLHSPFSINLDTIQEVQCFGECNGQVVLNTFGAIPPYTYSWSNGQTYLGPSSDTVFTLCQGGHSVIIQDAYGCDTIVYFTISEPPALYAQATVIQPVQCYGFNDGKARVVGVGGAPFSNGDPYLYSWSPISSTPPGNDTVINLTPGEHIVTITDSNFCTATDTVFITEPDELHIEIQDSTPFLVYPYCLGTNSGQLCAIATGGTPGYNYAWNNSAQLTACAINLAAGLYTVSVIDARSCVASDSFNLDSITNTMIPDSVDIQVSHISCNAYFDGSVIINNVAGGVGPFTYTWNGPGSFSATGSSISGLYQGNYSVVIEDINGCVINTSVDVEQPDYLEYKIDYVIDESCSGDGPFSAPSVSGGSCNGMVILEITGGTSPYYYDNTFTGAVPIPLSNQEIIDQDTLIDGFCDGSYNIHIQDANGCEGWVVVGGSFTANVGEGYVVSIPGVKTTDATCFNTFDGKAWVQGGADPFLNYSWESNSNMNLPSGSILSTNHIYSGFYPGNYWLVAHFSDSLSFGQNYPGCDVSMPFTMGSPIPITSNETIKHVTCFGDTDGSITLNPLGAEPPFVFLWDTLLSIPYSNITNQNQNQLAPGSYTVNITDATGCVLTQTIDVIEPNPLIANFNVTNVSCYNEDDGQAVVIVDPNSGLSPYTYLWNNGATSQTVDNLAGGVYTVEVTDSNGLGCSAMFNVVIVEPDPLVASAQANSFYGEDINLGTFHISCFGANDGSIIVANTGGTGNVSYEWQNSIGITVSNTQNASNLPADTYILTATDANGCKEDTSITLNQPNEIMPNVDVSNYFGFNISCYGLYDGFAVSNPTGGYVGPYDYNYVWQNSNGIQISFKDSVFSLPANFSYTVTVTDVNNCSASQTVGPFTQPLPFIANLSTLDYPGPTHAPFVTNFVDSTISTDPFNFTWYWKDGIDFYSSGTTNFAHTFTEENIGLNDIYVVLTNEVTTCTDTFFFNIDVQGVPEINNVFTPNGDEFNDKFYFGEHAMKYVEVQIFNRWGQKVYAWEGENKGWNGLDNNGENAPEGVYFYVLIGDGIDGHYYKEKGTITLLR